MNIDVCPLYAVTDPELRGMVVAETKKDSGKNEGNVNDTSINWILQIIYIYAMVHSPLSLGNSILTIKLFTSAEHLALLVAQLCLLRSISTNEKLNVLRM